MSMLPVHGKSVDGSSLELGMVKPPLKYLIIIEKQCVHHLDCDTFCQESDL